MPEKLDIPAINDDDFKKIIKKYGLLEKFESGTLKCALCENFVTYDNLYGIILIDDTPQLICDSNECNEKLKETGNG